MSGEESRGSDFKNRRNEDRRNEDLKAQIAVLENELVHTNKIVDDLVKENRNFFAMQGELVKQVILLPTRKEFDEYKQDTDKRVSAQGTRITLYTGIAIGAMTILKYIFKF